MRINEFEALKTLELHPARAQATPAAGLAVGSPGLSTVNRSSRNWQAGSERKINGASQHKWDKLMATLGCVAVCPGGRPRGSTDLSI